MATIQPVRSDALSGAGADVYVWSSVTESDTCAPIAPPALFGLAGGLEASGTFGGATVALHGSVSGSNYSALKDTSGTAIGLTAAGFVDFATAASFVKPVPSGGTSQSLTIYAVIRRD